MEGYYFFATLTAYIDLSDEEFQLLFSEAELHYDYKVQASTQQGGLLYGLQNQRKFAMEAEKPDNTCEFSESQLNLMMKALEMNRTQAAIKLHQTFLDVFKDLQRTTKQVNKPLNDIEIKGQFTNR